MRVVMIEPQGQGGICQYAYSLCKALSDTRSAETTLVTGHPYELANAPQPFSLATAFGPGTGRKAIQLMLRRSSTGKPVDSAATSASASALSHPRASVETVPYQAGSMAGKASRWLGARESDRGWKRAMRIVRQQQPAVAHIQWFLNAEHDRQWVDSLRSSGVPVVLTAHNILPHDAPEGTRETWRRLYASVNAIIVHYQGALGELDALGVDLGKVTVIPHGNYCAIQALNQKSGYAMSRRLAARSKLGLSPTAPVALTFGLMRPYKGVQHLLEAFVHVRRELPDARLILAGRAPEGFAMVRAEIDRLGLADATLALPTYLPLERVADVFEACDVVALPYVEASQSGVVQLAYAYSRPVVATRVGGIPEAVFEGETGLLIPPRDADQLALALVALLGDREHCAQLGERSRQIAEGRFAWEPIAEQTARVYEYANKAMG